MTSELTSELVNGLRDILGQNVQQIILYGSVARQEDGPDSDIDIAIILERKFDVQTRQRFIAWTAEMDLRYDRVFSIIDIEKENMEKWGSVLPFYKSICEEGIVLWKAA